MGFVPLGNPNVPPVRRWQTRVSVKTCYLVIRGRQGGGVPLSQTQNDVFRLGCYGGVRWGYCNHQQFIEADLVLSVDHEIIDLLKAFPVNGSLPEKLAKPNNSIASFELFAMPMLFFGCAKGLGH